MFYRRSHWSNLGVSEAVQDFLIAGELADTSVKSYENRWRHWVSFCEEHSLDHESPTIGDVSSFLLTLAQKDASYSTLKGTVAALNKFLPKIDGSSVDAHSVIVAFLKAHYRNNPPKPRYSSFWNPEKVLDCWRVDNSSLSLVDLSRKVFALCALSSLCRAMELHALLLYWPLVLLSL